MSAPALNPVRRRGSVDLPLSDELLVRVGGEELLPGNEGITYQMLQEAYHIII